MGCLTARFRSLSSSTSDAPPTAPAAPPTAPAAPSAPVAAHCPPAYASCRLPRFTSSFAGSLLLGAVGAIPIGAIPTAPICPPSSSLLSKSGADTGAVLGRTGGGAPAFLLPIPTSLPIFFIATVVEETVWWLDAALTGESQWHSRTQTSPFTVSSAMSETM